MYIFTTTKPQSDSAMESDIVIHEYAHGLSNRLTGGPQNVNCLPYGQSGGMGEGWGDFIATLWEMKASDKSDKIALMGSWVNNGKTIRRNPYTTDMKLNPTTYGFILKGYSQVHATGEIWANILYEVYWSLRAAMGGAFNDNWYSGDFNSANTLMMQLVIDGMKLQPCRPTFVSARDAIMQAEKLISGGKYRCALLKAFAKRGVGLKATTDGANSLVEDFTHDCPTAETPGGETTPDTPKPDTPTTPEVPKPDTPTTPEIPKPDTPTTPEVPKPDTPEPKTPEPTAPASKFHPRPSIPKHNV
jgi:extracellular elastinolytic metalloproteinase